MSAAAGFLTVLGQRLRRFGAAREAVAAVEFALILPVMLTMYVGSIELSQAFSMDQRVITIAGTTGDEYPGIFVSRPESAETPKAGPGAWWLKPNSASTAIAPPPTTVPSNLLCEPKLFPRFK